MRRTRPAQDIPGQKTRLSSVALFSCVSEPEPGIQPPLVRLLPTSRCLHANAIPGAVHTTEPTSLFMSPTALRARCDHSHTAALRTLSPAPSLTTYVTTVPNAKDVALLKKRILRLRGKQAGSRRPLRGHR